VFIELGRYLRRKFAFTYRLLCYANCYRHFHRRRFIIRVSFNPIKRPSNTFINVYNAITITSVILLFDPVPYRVIELYVCTFFRPFEMYTLRFNGYSYVNISNTILYVCSCCKRHRFQYGKLIKVHV